VALTWRGANNPQISGYRIYRSASAAGGFTLFGTVSGSPGVYFDSSPLLQGYYYLTAVDANGNASAASATLSARLGGAGIAPQLSANTITARASESKVAFLQGNVPVKTIAWQIERGSSASGPFAVLPQGLVKAGSYFDTSVQNGATYYYRLTPVGVDGVLGSASVFGPLNPLDVAPARPEGLSLEVASGNALIEWNPPVEQDVAGYNIYRQAYGQSTGQKRNSALIPGTSFNDSVELSRVYTWRVTAVDNAGHESAPSEFLQASTWPFQSPNMPNALLFLPLILN